MSLLPPAIDTFYKVENTELFSLLGVTFHPVTANNFTFTAQNLLQKKLIKL